MNYFTDQKELFLDFLKEIVCIESPSGDAHAVNLLSKHIQGRFQEIGIKSTVLDGTPWGNHLHLTYGEGQEKILLLCHMDTVWKQGSLKRMPFRVEGDKAFGPGIFDMKAGIASLWCVFNAFKELNTNPQKKIIALITSDEEIGSASAKKYIAKYAKDCKGVLVLEPAGDQGALKTSRKGLGMAKVRFTGCPSHAGLDHEKGLSAIRELAHFIIQAESYTNYSLGTTVNVGMVNGGSAANVVPAEAYAEVDFRFSKPEEGERVEAFLRNYLPKVKGVKVEVNGGIDRPPMVRTPESAGLFKKAKAIAKDMGFSLGEVSVGGVSDGNWTSAMGIPTLDGLGAIGMGAHAENEHIVISECLKRIELLYKLMLKV